MGLLSGSGRSSGGGNNNPLQYSCLGDPMDRGAWWATVHRVAKSRTWLSMHTCTHTTLILCSSVRWQLLVFILNFMVKMLCSKLIWASSFSSVQCGYVIHLKYSYVNLFLFVWHFRAPNFILLNINIDSKDKIIQEDSEKCHSPTITSTQFPSVLWRKLIIFHFILLVFVKISRKMYIFLFTFLLTQKMAYYVYSCFSVLKNLKRYPRNHSFTFVPFLLICLRPSVIACHSLYLLFFYTL